MTERSTPPRISLRLTAKVTWDWNSVGAELELEDEPINGETLDEARARIKKWVSDSLQEDLTEFKQEVEETYVPKRKRNR